MHLPNLANAGQLYFTAVYSGLMLNFGNPVAWLLIAGFVAWWAGLAVLGAAAGM